MFTYLEFHDSVLAEVNEVGHDCILQLRPAYIHRSEPTPGVPPGDGFWQDVRIRIANAKVNKTALKLPLWIGSGILTVGEIRMSSIAPSELREMKPVYLKLELESLAELLIEGSSIEITAIGEPDFGEIAPVSSK